MLAVLSDDARTRDTTWKWFAELDQKKIDGYEKGWQQLASVAKLLAADHEAGGEADFDDLEVEKALPKDISFRPVYYFAYAGYFDRHGKPKQAEEYLIKAVTTSAGDKNKYRTIAGDMLLTRGIDPAKYKNRWTEPVATSGPKSSP